MVPNALFLYPRLHFICSGKKRIVKILEERDLRKTVRVFYKNHWTAQCIASVGERIILALYNVPQKTTSLNVFRYNCLLKSVAGNRSQTLINIPPSKAAADQTCISGVSADSGMAWKWVVTHWMRRDGRKTVKKKMAYQEFYDWKFSRMVSETTY